MSRHTGCQELLKRLRAVKHALYAINHREEMVGRTTKQLASEDVGVLGRSLSRTVATLATNTANDGYEVDSPQQHVYTARSPAFFLNERYSVRPCRVCILYSNIESLITFVTLNDSKLQHLPRLSCPPIQIVNLTGSACPVATLALFRTVDIAAPSVPTSRRS